MAASKVQQLDELKQRIIDDKITPDLAASATQLVFGDGNIDSEIVFIGEAPGKNEDLQGKPFVGASGKFLNEMLDMIGMVRDDIYITNIVKYRPPENRDPKPEEKKAFLPYLQRQLEIIQPKVVVTLGRHSMNCFLPDLQISKVHGEPKRVRIQFHGPLDRQGVSTMQGTDEQQTGAVEDGTAEGAAESVTQQGATSLVILPLFHPAAALYNPLQRQVLIDDFAKIPAIIKKIKSTK